ncbi:hypothetical protein KM043_014057 [Ampulex compressa]|nr:hypothetical protein KM043_014057 [Ampulex compressa]
MAAIRFGILTVSDSSYKDKSLDKSGPELQQLITDDTTVTGGILKGRISCVEIVKDDKSLIMKYLVSWCDKGKADVIFTTGGTGLSPRDVTPEATKKVIDREAYGISISMLTSSLKVTPMAMLSRPVCGIRNKTLIINLPGSPKAAKECLSAIAVAIPHAVDLIRGNEKNVKETHKLVQSELPNVCSHEHIHKTVSCIKDVAKRNRESPYPMISVEEAVEILRKSVETKETEIVSIWKVHGRVLANDVHSQCDLPPFRASIKDGYAVLASDGVGRRTVLGGINAGNSTPGTMLTPGTCVRVNTGAPIPDEATAVVQVEDTKLIEKTQDDTEEKEIEILVESKDGQDIRAIGSDIEKNSLVLKSYTKIGAAEVGLLAACGCEEVEVFRQPVIGVLSTGDELQEPGIPLTAGHVYDSNKITLLSIFKENGFDSMDMGVAQDNEMIMIEKIKRALEQVDVLVTSGSVSMGDRDMLKPILEQHFNATIHFGRVNMKPGKPTTFGTCMFQGRKKYLLCLPGNPVSATVTTHLFVLPLLKEMCGNLCKPIIVRATLTSSYNLDPRPEYARAILKWDDTDVLPKAYSTGNQISSKLLSCKDANALLMLPGRTKEKPELREGDVAHAMLLYLKA